MKTCAFLTMDNLEAYECYDSLLKGPMASLGWRVLDISWRNKQIDWNDFEAVIIRSTWDYQLHCEEFLAVLNVISQSKATLMNCLDLVRWNINKNYLATLESEGVLIVPTLWQENYSAALLENAFATFETDNLIIKPCISAGASDTYRLNKKAQKIEHRELEKLFNKREFMLQPFMPSIIEEGEFSLFYFNSQFSHAILKKPQSNDFRVQEEYGGQLTLIQPSETLKTAAKQALVHLPNKPLYARLDFVRSADSFLLMEAELIEPSLYFNMDAGSPARFARAFVEYFNLNSIVS